MSLSTLPLSYCTNVHPGRTVSEVVAGLKEHAIPARQKLAEPMAAGLWLAASVVEELERDPGQLAVLQQALADGDLVCYTLNAFPFGDFHHHRVKENVYLPDWTASERRDYTISCARLLAQLMPAGVEGSLSTVPLGFREFSQQPDFFDRCIDNLLTVARELDELHDETGQVLRIAIEPEPCCLLETTPETVAFFQKLYQAADAQGLAEVARRHLGVCYDVCHQAVEFEDVAESIQALEAAGIRINKVHITCAIHVDRPADRPDALQELACYVEPRYLHQTFARGADGSIQHVADLTEELCERPAGPFANAAAWRVHFHVPVHCEQLGELGTTRGELRSALSAVARLGYAPHLEVETYTWGVLPDEEKPALSESLYRELSATRELLRSVATTAQGQATDH